MPLSTRDLARLAFYQEPQNDNRRNSCVTKSISIKRKSKQIYYWLTAQLVNVLNQLTSSGTTSRSLTS